MKKNKFYIAGIILISLSVIIGNTYYQKVFGKAILTDTEFFVYSDNNLKDIIQNLDTIANSPSDFLWVANKKKFKKPKPGKYLLKKGMSFNDVVNLFRSGNQTPLKVSFNNQETIYKFVGRVASQLETDSISLLNAFINPIFLTQNNLTTTSVLGICIPNSYELYWTISPKDFRNRMLTEYNRFWNKNRILKAKNQQLTPQEVMTLASIVQKETAKISERPIVAGLYLNRLKNGWLLQSDPTVIYAIKAKKGQNFEIKRVLNKDLKIDSPYNTYKYKGLPPSLITMPDISSIDAVLNPSKHSYFYMCANPDQFGYHLFASSLRQHSKNAKKYQRWLQKVGIRR